MPATSLLCQDDDNIIAAVLNIGHPQLRHHEDVCIGIHSGQRQGMGKEKMDICTVSRLRGCPLPVVKNTDLSFNLNQI